MIKYGQIGFGVLFHLVKDMDNGQLFYFIAIFFWIKVNIINI